MVEQRTRVKVILDRWGHAIYFSRGVLPANKDGRVRDYPTPFRDQPYLLHLGLACFDRAFLAQYCRMPPTPLMVSANLFCFLFWSLRFVRFFAWVVHNLWYPFRLLLD